ncbi:UNKNOWN [Stylonychia lemnae]|uniref:Uncharacterized protein n=1 Tax=Stylonychia lemnae TaxID=5949 RepID=A0A078B5Z2_STYLE|nr:UNKNOWN [Stylonychia lemnae]|eukprot:CDW89646.1 UNKNOWN [Stylonychia lemnae]
MLQISRTKLSQFNGYSRFESDDTTDRIQEEIKKLNKQILSSNQMPYIMNQREKQMHNQITKSLRIIEKRQIAFQKVEEDINDHDRKNILSRGIKHRKSNLDQQDQMLSKSSDGIPSARYDNKTFQLQLNENQQSQHIIYPKDVSKMLKEKHEYNNSDIKYKRSNYTKFQDDLLKRFELIKNTAANPMVTDKLMSQANRVHYTAVNPYKSLQQIISKQKFQVRQFSHKKTTGINMGLSIDRVLKKEDDESENTQGQIQQQQFLPNTQRSQYPSIEKQKLEIEEALGQMVISYGAIKERMRSRVINLLEQKKSSISNLEPEIELIKQLHKKSQSVENLIKRRKTMRKSQIDQVNSELIQLQALNNMSSLSPQIPIQALLNPDSQFRQRRKSVNKTVLGYSRNSINLSRIDESQLQGNINDSSIKNAMMVINSQRSYYIDGQQSKNRKKNQSYLSKSINSNTGGMQSSRSYIHNQPSVILKPHLGNLSIRILDDSQGQNSSIQTINYLH